MIDLIDVSKIYPVKGSDDVVALDHVNLHVKQEVFTESWANQVPVSQRSFAV